MVIFKKILLILFFILISIIECSQDYQKTKAGIPTTKGIQKYIRENENQIVKEFNNFVGDSLLDYYISTDNLSEYMNPDSLELGRSYLPSEIIITSEEKYVAYKLSDLPLFKRKTAGYDNKFVKAVLLHELTHIYVSQILREMSFYNIPNSPEYNAISYFPRSEFNFGASFIEEGICEWIPYKMGEIIEPKKPFIPQNKEEILNPKNLFIVKYQYSAFYVGPFLEEHGVKRGIILLLSNRAPSYDEILHPEKYFYRLNTNIK